MFRRFTSLVFEAPVEMMKEGAKVLGSDSQSTVGLTHAMRSERRTLYSWLRGIANYSKLGGNYLEELLQKVERGKDLDDSPKVMFDQLVEHTRANSIVRDPAKTALACREFQNRMAVFWQVLGSGVAAAGEAESATSLAERIKLAERKPGVLRVQAFEGLGRACIATAGNIDLGSPQVVDQATVASLPEYSRLSINLGVGLGLAEMVFSAVEEDAGDEELVELLERVLQLCREQSTSGFLTAAAESVGVYLRVFRARLSQRFFHLVQSASIEDESRKAFWHGVGRAYYFLASHSSPGSIKLGFERIVREAPMEEALRNMVSGFAFAVTFVNLRSPEVVDGLFLQEINLGDAPREPLSEGCVLACCLFERAKRDGDETLEAFLAYEPNNTAARQLWSELISIPARKSVEENRGMSGVQMFKLY